MTKIAKKTSSAHSLPTKMKKKKQLGAKGKPKIKKAMKVVDKNTGDKSKANASEDDWLDLENEFADGDITMVDISNNLVLPRADSDEAAPADGDAIDDDEVHDHQAALERLKVTDPEFHAFLEDHDKQLLNFSVADESDEDGDADVHVPSGHLEVASDESDGDEDAPPTKQRAGDTTKVTLSLLKKWQARLQTESKSNAAIVDAIGAFNAALAAVGATSGDAQGNAAYRVEGAAVFNATIQLCVLHLGAAVRRFLRLRPKQAPHTAKRFVKVRGALRDYFGDLQRLLGGVAHSGNIALVLVKHVHEVAPLLVSFGAQTRALLRRAVRLWAASGNERVRVLAFLAVVRLVDGARDAHLERTLKFMYLSYVQNSRFVSVRTLPAINFMRRSLVEMFAMDARVAYRHVFLYVRQLAIHLRNAMCARARRDVHVVYNWQYVNSLRLWGALLVRVPQLDALVYPFVQVCLGCMRLQATPAYVPLRFHVCRILTEMSRSAAVGAPVLPFLVGALDLVAAGSKTKRVALSMKPLSVECALRVGNAQRATTGFKDAVVDGVYAGVLEHAAVYAASIAFPELFTMPRLQIKEFVRTCPVRKYTQKMGQLLAKLDENAAFIERARATFTDSIADGKRVDAWEAQTRLAGTPLMTFFADWDAVRSLKRAKLATNNDAIGDYNLPALVRKPKRADGAPADVKVELFPSDSSDHDDAEAEVEAKPKRARGKRGSKKGKRQPAGAGDAPADNKAADIVEDITDW